MLNLNTKENLEKAKKVLKVIVEALEFKTPTQKTVIIPTKDFEKWGLTISEADIILHYLEENELIRDVGRKRLEKALLSGLYPVRIGKDFITFKNKDKEYTEIYLKDFEITVRSKKRVKEFLQKVIEKQDWLVCNKLKFNIKNGDAVCGRVKTNFRPESQEYKLLKALIEFPNVRLNYERINKILNTKNSKKSRRDIQFIMGDIRKKLKMSGKGKINKNIFKAGTGYRIVCG